LAHPSFAQAVERFLTREDQGIDQYMAHLAARQPLRAVLPSTTPPSGPRRS
jgi:uncharacterized protein